MPEFWNRTPTQLPEHGTPVSAAASSGKPSGLKATLWFSAIQKSPLARQRCHRVDRARLRGRWSAADSSASAPSRRRASTARALADGPAPRESRPCARCARSCRPSSRCCRQTRATTQRHAQLRGAACQQRGPARLLPLTWISKPAMGSPCRDARGWPQRALARARICSKSLGTGCRSSRRPAFTSWLGMSWPISAGSRRLAASRRARSTPVS